VNTPQIAEFARLAKENTPPVGALEGQKTLISRTMHALEYDPIHDEIVVNSPLTESILTFKGGSKGEEPPVRVISGPHTQIRGTAYDGNDKMGMDSVNGEYYIPVSTHEGAGEGAILVFDREANGDVPPKRVLTGPDTQFRFPTARGQGLPNVAVDGVRNLLVVSTGGSLLIFDRTANGNTKPKAIIKGPKTGLGGNEGGGGGGQVKVYSPKGLVVGTCSGGAVCAWNIEDTGDVAPLWKIPARQLTGVAFSGLALDPMHKEVILPSGGQNVIVTFSWPEIFD
jgi:hypothetical protein